MQGRCSWLFKTVLKTVWLRNLLRSDVIQVTPVPAETLLQATNWPQHVSCSVLYRKGVSLFEVKGVPPGNADTSKKSLRTWVACGVNARVRRTATHLTKLKWRDSLLFGSGGLSQPCWNLRNLCRICMYLWCLNCDRVLLSLPTRKPPSRTAKQKPSGHIIHYKDRQ